MLRKFLCEFLCLLFGNFSCHFLGIPSTVYLYLFINLLLSITYVDRVKSIGNVFGKSFGIFFGNSFADWFCTYIRNFCQAIIFCNLFDNYFGNFFGHSCGSSFGNFFEIIFRSSFGNSIENLEISLDIFFLLVQSTIPLICFLNFFFGC